MLRAFDHIRSDDPARSVKNYSCGLSRAGSASVHLWAHNDQSMPMVTAMMAAMMSNNNYLAHQRLQHRYTRRGKKY